MFVNFSCLITPFPIDNIKVLKGGGSISYHLLPALVSTLNLLLSAVSKQGPKHSFSVSASLLSTLLLYSSDHHSVQKQTILFVSSWLTRYTFSFWCSTSLWRCHILGEKRLYEHYGPDNKWLQNKGYRTVGDPISLCDNTSTPVLIDCLLKYKGHEKTPRFFQFL